MNHRIQYLRDNKGQPVGCLAIGKDSKGNIGYQYSVLNPLDRFNRLIAKRIATGRLAEKPIMLYKNQSVPSDLRTKYRITQAIFLSMQNNKHVPSRARKAAKLWLKINQETGK